MKKRHWQLTNVTTGSRSRFHVQGFNHYTGESLSWGIDGFDHTDEYFMTEETVISPSAQERFLTCKHPPTLAPWSDMGAREKMKALLMCAKAHKSLTLAFGMFHDVAKDELEGEPCSRMPEGSDCMEALKTLGFTEAQVRNALIQ